MNTHLTHIQDWADLAKRANWSVTDAAKICKISVRGLEVYFLRTFGEPPKAWMFQQRQKLAKELLANAFSVKEVAVQLGYKHAHHFSRDFKKYWGFCATQTGKPTQFAS